MSGQGDEMSRSARASGYLTWPRGAGAILLAGCLAATPASGQSTGTAVSTGMAGQKARMLEGFFSSYRLREALGSNPDAVGPLAAEARAKAIPSTHEAVRDALSALEAIGVDEVVLGPAVADIDQLDRAAELAA